MLIESAQIKVEANVNEYTVFNFLYMVNMRELYIQTLEKDHFFCWRQGSA